MRILSFTTLFPNSAQPLHGLFVRARVSALARLAEVRVVAPVPGPGWFGHGLKTRGVPATERQDGLVVHHPRYFNVPKLLKGTDAALLARGARSTFREVVRDFAPDWVDAHWAYPDGAAAALLARAAGLPYSVTLRGDDISTFLRTPSRRGRIVESLNGAAAVIGVCTPLLEAAQQAGVRADHCHVVPNGVDTELFRPVDRAQSREALGLPADAPLLLSVGFLSERKGFHLLVRALPLLRSARGGEARLAIVGGAGAEGDWRGRLEAEARRLGLQERVTFAGSVPPADLKRWYSAADLFCLASEREGMPNVLLEAFACGCPVLAVPVWGVPETVPGDFAGLLVERDERALAKGIDAGLEREWDRARIREHACGRTWDGAARACLDVFEGALRR